MKIASARRSMLRGRPPRGTGDPLAAGPRMYLTLAADGVEAEADQRSVPRKAFVGLVVFVLLFAAPFYWVTSAPGSSHDHTQAVLVKSSSDDDDDDDQGDDDTGGSDPGTGRETAAANTDRPGLHTGASTRGETDPGDHTGATEQGSVQKNATGRETAAANTDRPGLHTGASTAGETDPGDHTGQTERV